MQLKRKCETKHMGKLLRCWALNLLVFFSLKTCMTCAANNYKVGTGYKFINAADLSAMKGLHWWYNWGTGPVSNIEQYAFHKGVEYVPMQWSKWGIESLLETPYLANATTLLGYNEPNHREQGNLEPQEAASLWGYLEEAAETFDLRLGAPSAAPCGSDCVRTNPFDWWDEFFFYCRNCTVDFLAVHIYSCNSDMFASFLEECKKYGLPVWVTEFACPTGPGPHLISQQLFMDAAISHMEDSKEVERYAWFAPRVESGWVGESASLLHPDKPLLSLLGEQYLGLGPSTRIPSIRKSFGDASWPEMCQQCFDEALLSNCHGSCSNRDASTEELCQHCRDCGFLTRNPVAMA